MSAPMGLTPTERAQLDVASDILGKTIEAMRDEGVPAHVLHCALSSVLLSLIVCEGTPGRYEEMVGTTIAFLRDALPAAIAARDLTGRPA